MLYSYLWGGGPDKVKRVTVVEGYEQCGLRVIYINKVIVALKITRLRRYNTNHFKLVKVICPCISDFDNFGSDYATQSKRHLNISSGIVLLW